MTNNEQKNINQTQDINQKKINKEHLFLDFFPNAKFRYIDANHTQNIKLNPQRPKIIKSETLNNNLNRQGYDSYFTVSGFKAGEYSERADDIININAFFIDIDGRKDFEEIADICDVLKPTFIIETGRGFHLYWCLDAPIYRDEVSEDEWNDTIVRWKKVQNTIVSRFKGDPAVKDITRIMRVPNTFYWKNTGTKWSLSDEENSDTVIIKGVEKNIAHTYSIETMEEIFQLNNITQETQNELGPEYRQYIQNNHTQDFFGKINSLFPITERDSFKRIVSGEAGTLIEDSKNGEFVYPRHTQLMCAASLMYEAGWTLDYAIETIKKTGWHGVLQERGEQEIVHAITDVYTKYPLFGRKRQDNGEIGITQKLIEHNKSDQERARLSQAIVDVMKARKEQDRVRFSVYEQELMKKYPHTLKNEQNIIFMYENGVYKMMLEDNLITLILREMEDDMLLGYRTPKNARDKIACWLTHIKPMRITENTKILNVKNGLLDIETLELKPHTPEFVSLYQSPVAFDPTATAPTFMETLHAWTKGPEAEEKQRLLQQYCGYILMPTMKYAMMMFLVGDGGNGKSTFVDTIARVVGDKGTSHVDLEDINGSFGLQRLIGARLNVVEEVSGGYYKSNKLKSLVSGEPVTINIKYQPQFDMRPEAKFIFAVNEMPKVDDTSLASERRTLIVLFNNNFRDNPDVDLRYSTGKLAQELPGILNWCLAGIKSLNDMGGFVKTEEHLQALREYREESSSFEAYFAECIEYVEGAQLTGMQIYENYQKYCHESGFKMVGKKQTLTKILQQKAHREKKFQFIPRKNGKEDSYFEGIQFTDFAVRNTMEAVTRWANN